jgi:hypothetical protein
VHSAPRPHSSHRHDALRCVPLSRWESRCRARGGREGSPMWRPHRRGASLSLSALCNVVHVAYQKHDVVFEGWYCSHAVSYCCTVCSVPVPVLCSVFVQCYDMLCSANSMCSRCRWVCACFCEHNFHTSSSVLTFGSNSRLLTMVQTLTEL